MIDGEFDVAVVLMIFNRPEHTREVFDRIAAVRPKQLFVIADGPRPGRPDDVRKCAESRAILNHVNWNCDLETNFAGRNLGCRGRTPSGLDWVFAKVDRAIILEDDCVPDTSFFPFCAELLETYKDDLRVGTISGNNFLHGKARTNWSYYFSIFPFSWGWATWRRSWQKVDMEMRQWPEVRDGGWLVDMVGDRRLARFLASRFDRTYQGLIDAWDYQYFLSCLLDQSLTIAPNVNLVENIGFGEDATHTRNAAKYIGCPAEFMSFPLRHPPFMVCDRVADREAFRRRCLPEEGPWLKRTLRPLYHALPGMVNRHTVRLGTGRLVERRAQSAERLEAAVRGYPANQRSLQQR